MKRKPFIVAPAVSTPLGAGEPLAIHATSVEAALAAIQGETLVAFDGTNHDQASRVHPVAAVEGTSPTVMECEQ